MSPEELLLLALLLEASILAGGLLLLFGHAAWRSARTAWLRPRMCTFRTAVAQVLAGQPLPTVPWLPQKEAVDVLAQAARTVDLTAHAQLRALPVYDVLVSRAEKWCRSRRWVRRLKGVRLLTILGAGERAVPRLLPDNHPEVRSAAAAWVAQHPTPERTATLIQMLEDDAPSCRQVARATLIKIGRQALHPIVEHLKTPESAALASILSVAAQLADPTLLAPTLPHTTSPDAAVRTGAAKVLTALGGAEAIETLEVLLSDKNAAVRAAAVVGLGTLAHWPSAPLIADRLSDSAWTVRHAAGLSLGRLGAPGRLYLRRACDADDRFASDMARQVLDLPGHTFQER